MNSGTVGARPVADAPPETLDLALDLVTRCARMNLRLVPEEAAPDRRAIPVAPGWLLEGPGPRDRLRAAADLMARLHRGEDEIRELCNEVLERYEEATLVYRLCERTGEVLGERAIARFVLDEAARVLGARSGGIWWSERDGRDLRPAATFPESPVRWNLTYGEALSVVGTGRPWVTEAGPDGQPGVAVPLPGGDGKPLGLLALWGRPDGRAYRTGEIKLLGAIANLASAFIRNERLSAEARRVEARRREDEIARQIHRGLLPHGEPCLRGLEICGCCRAAENIGGDYYGYLEFPDGSLGLAMADVSGHGVGAALYMAAAKGALQAEARRVLSPAGLLWRLNEALVGDFSKSDVFATVFFARIEPDARRFDFASGGHNPPLLIRAGGGVETLDPTGPALGVLPALDYHEESRKLAAGDALVIYTDGLVEGRDPDGRPYGGERLRNIATSGRARGAREMRDRILEDLAGHCGKATAQDDVTLVVVKAVEAS